MRRIFLILVLVASLQSSLAYGQQQQPSNQYNQDFNSRNRGRPLPRCSGETQLVFTGEQGRKVLGIEKGSACVFSPCRRRNTKAVGEVNAQIIVGREKRFLCFLDRYTLNNARRRRLDGILPKPIPLGHFEHLNEVQKDRLAKAIVNGRTYKKATKNLSKLMRSKPTLNNNRGGYPTRNGPTSYNSNYNTRRYSS